MQTFIENVDGELVNAAHIYKITADASSGATRVVIVAHIGQPGSPGSRDRHDLSAPLFPERAQMIARQLAAMVNQGGTLTIIENELVWTHRLNDSTGTSIKSEVILS